MILNLNDLFQNLGLFNFFFKVFIILISLIYLIFIITMIRQVSVMTKTVKFKTNSIIIFISFIQLIIGMGLLILAIFI